MDQNKTRESYKPVELRDKIRLQKLPDKKKPFTEEDFRMKVRESRNKLERKESGLADRVFYTHLSKTRQNVLGKEKPEVLLKNCRRYLDFMEQFIIDAVKERN